MKRKNVHLSDEQIKGIDEVDRGLNFSETVRRAVDHYLDYKKAKKRKEQNK